MKAFTICCTFSGTPSECSCGAAWRQSAYMWALRIRKQRQAHDARVSRSPPEGSAYRDVGHHLGREAPFARGVHERAGGAGCQRAELQVACTAAAQQPLHGRGRAAAGAAADQQQQAAPCRRHVVLHEAAEHVRAGVIDVLGVLHLPAMGRRPRVREGGTRCACLPGEGTRACRRARRASAPLPPCMCASV